MPSVCRRTQRAISNDPTKPISSAPSAMRPITSDPPLGGLVDVVDGHPDRDQRDDLAVAVTGTMARTDGPRVPV